MATSYFHLCPIMLTSGSIIEPGNFGRVIETYRPNSIGPLAVRELTFEVARLKNFPDKPSRFNSIFLFPTLQHAQAQLFRFDISSLIYEVELTNPSQNLFHGNMGLVHEGFPNEHIPAIPHLYNLAAQYWTGLDNIQAESEFLSSSSIRILRHHEHRVEASELTDLQNNGNSTASISTSSSS
ncbi:hypothetical protein [Methylotenera sp.]|uniref:hypothetical protein n=1 Tax=Methylotenera sp. TaxID=2051956 RepID=UPI00248A4D87|nr:hypothetical protein [Methylotenera sp.]MDI1361419.1 hypothetical protein [Methylotenera sp.]